MRHNSGKRSCKNTLQAMQLPKSKLQLRPLRDAVNSVHHCFAVEARGRLACCAFKLRVALDKIVSKQVPYKKNVKHLKKQRQEKVLLMWVAVDASSGDHGESPIVHGSILAAKELGAHVILVGNSEKIEPILREHPEIKDKIQVEHTAEVIGMDESPAMAVRSKKNASVNIAASLVASGRAVGFFSPGNTGASMAAALKHLGRIPGVKRPAIATPIPRESAGPVFCTMM